MSYSMRFNSSRNKSKDRRSAGRQIHARRLAIVEPVFANIRVQKRLDRFTLRSKARVDVQWKLLALIHNLGKIHRYGRTQ
jgi:IS5 family transposase